MAQRSLHLLAYQKDLVCGQNQVEDRPATLTRGLVQQHARVLKDRALSRLSSRDQQRRARERLSGAEGGGYRHATELDGVVEREGRGDGAAG